MKAVNYVFALVNAEISNNRRGILIKKNETMKGHIFCKNINQNNQFPYYLSTNGQCVRRVLTI